MQRNYFFYLIYVLILGISFPTMAAGSKDTDPEYEKDLYSAAKGEHNLHPEWRARSLDEAGGPDGFGYFYSDSQEPDGPAYAWTDISSTGTPIVGMGDDDFEGPIALPWNFEFYGVGYSEVYIGSNGFIQFGAGSTVYNNTPIPQGDAPNNLIALFWDDLNPASGGTIYYGMNQNGNWVCQFQAVREYGASGTITAQIILQSDGAILLQYQSLAGGIDINGETIGIEDAAGTIGLMTSLDAAPAAYPFNGLAIQFELRPPDATVSGIITETGTGLPIEGAQVRFGATEAITNSSGSYVIGELWAGSYDVEVLADGYFDHNEGSVQIAVGANTYDASLESSGFPSGMVGYWTFDNSADLTAATTGNDLELVGSHAAIPGPTPGDGAITIGEGSFYRCYHDIAANGPFGNPQWVNDFSIVMDIRIPALGDWYCLYQTNWPNSNDGDLFINPSGQIGVNATGYSAYSLIPGEWYRFVLTSSLGEHYDYYLDGQLLLLGGAQDFEGRFSLYPVDNANQVLFFADENGEDGPIDASQIMLFDRDLTGAEIDSLGGYGHEFESPEPPFMNAYLETPTPTSIYISWHSATSTESIVEYGLTEALGMSTSGTIHEFNPGTIWHTVHLTGLEPDTRYYYKCITGPDESTVNHFRTQPLDGERNTVVRFLIYGDTRTDVAAHEAVVNAMADKLMERYGPDFADSVNCIINVGDIVTTGSVLSQYQNEHFFPTRSLAVSIPYMISIGNHEGEHPNFYNYMHYDDFAGPEGELYYSWRSARVQFISLNSNTQGATQINWLSSVLETAQNDTSIDWIIATLHHPGRSEIWPDGNTAWVQNSVIPVLQSYPKADLLAYGHSHNYERGAVQDGNLRLMLTGGGGSALDRWRMYDNQQDYPELHRSLDHYCYNLFEIDQAAGTMTMEAFSLGHADLPLTNVLIDSFYRHKIDALPPEIPLALAPADSGDYPPTLTASPFTAMFEIMSSQFQLSTDPADWQNPTLDMKRDWENVYYDTGSPLWEPIDLNAGIDLTRLAVGAGEVSLGQTYWWRVRCRDQNLLWSDWSVPAQFTVANLADRADFVADTTRGLPPFTVRFTDLSTGPATGWNWDLDGDGQNNSNDRDPVWTYDSSGVFDVSLTTNFGGPQQTATKISYIEVVSTTVRDLAISIAGTDVVLRWTNNGMSLFRIYSSSVSEGVFPEFEGETESAEFIILGGVDSDVKFFYVVAVR